MYELPDYFTELPKVQDLHARNIQQLYDIGVTMLRVDAAIYEHVPELASMINRVPWDLIYQEWWGEYPPQDRTQYIGNYRDVAYRWKVVNALAGKDIKEFPDLLKLDSGVFGISQEMAVYPFSYHDGRTTDADPEIAIYKNGLEYHQQQRFFLAWPFGITVKMWGGYGWTDLVQGPPGCENNMPDKCIPESVYNADGSTKCMPTPDKSPLPFSDAQKRDWICEHRWQGVAGMVNFRKACRGQQLAQTWEGGQTDGVALGHVAFRLGLSATEELPLCFVALSRGHRDGQSADQSGGVWQLQGLLTGLPAGRYCDLASLSTQKDWTRTKCPREVEIGSSGEVLAGIVPEGEILAIHTAAMLWR